MVGIQSQGKTTMLNIFAGRLIAGGMADNCGTMRAVVYTFKTSTKVARSLSLGAGTAVEKFDSDDALFRRVDSIMLPLQRAGRYDAEPISITVTGPTCFSCVVEDLPGLPLLRDELNADNYDQVKAIISERMAEPHVVPIVVQLVDQVADPSKVVQQMRLIRNAMDVPEEVQHRSLFVPVSYTHLTLPTKRIV